MNAAGAESQRSALPLKGSQKNTTTPFWFQPNVTKAGAHYIKVQKGVKQILSTHGPAQETRVLRMRSSYRSVSRQPEVSRACSRQSFTSENFRGLVFFFFFLICKIPLFQNLSSGLRVTWKAVLTTDFKRPLSF